MANRRALVRKVKRDLAQTLNQLFAGKKPTADQAQAALENALKYYPLPANVGVRLNRVKDTSPPVLELEVFNPIEEDRQEKLRALAKNMSPEMMVQMTALAMDMGYQKRMQEYARAGRQFGKSNAVAAYVESLLEAPEKAKRLLMKPRAAGKSTTIAEKK